MRANFKPQLLARLRANPATAGIIPESVAYGGSAIRQRKDQWQAGDGPPSSADFDFRDDGGLAIKATNAVTLQNVVQNAYLRHTDKRRSGDYQTGIGLFEGSLFVTTKKRSIFSAAKVVWGGTEDADLEIQDVRCYINPDIGTLGPLPVWLELHIYAGFTLSGDTGSATNLIEICDPMRVLAPQVSGDVTFDFSTRAERPKPKLYNLNNDGAWSYFEIRPLDATGAVLLSTLTTTITSAGTLATATTASPHGMVGATIVRIAGANQARYNGDFIATPTGATTFTYTMADVAASPATGTITTSFANVGWGRDSGTASLTTAGNQLTAVRLATYDTNDRWQETDEATLPTMRIRTGTYVAKTITLSGANVLDLLATPLNDVEFIGQGNTPGTTSITYEVSDDAGANWYAFTDGMIAVTDLPNVSIQQTYSIRATLTPGTGGSSTPVLRILGAQERTSKYFNGLATVSGGQGSIDPITLKGEISEITITAIRDGVADYNDAITALLSQNYLGNIEWRIWIGPHDPVAYPRSAHPELWGLIDSYLIDDYGMRDGAVELTCVSPLSLIREAFPPFDDATGTRETYVQSEALLTTVYNDILDGEIGLPARYCGPRPVDTTTRVSKTVTDSDAKVELDALLAVIGWGHISSQGRLKAVDMYGSKAVVRSFGREDVKWDFVSPGFRNRIPEFFVPYDYDQASDTFLREVHGFNANAITRLGKARFDPPTELDSEVAKWVRSVSVTSITSAAGVATVTTAHDHGLTSGELVTILGAIQTAYNIDVAVTVTGATTFTYPVGGGPASPATGTITCSILAHRIANRVTTFLGPGLILINFTSQYAYPELEVGDLISVETDRFIAYDPTTSNRSLRGLVQLRGVVQAVHDVIGTQFTIWVRSYASIVPTTAHGTRDNPDMDRAKAYDSGNQNFGFLLDGNITFNSEEYDDGDLHSTAVNTDRITVVFPGRYAITAQVHYNVLTNPTVTLSLLKNGATELAHLQFFTLAEDVLHLSVTADLVAGDYITILDHTAAIGTHTVKGGASDTWLAVHRVR